MGPENHRQKYKVEVAKNEQEVGHIQQELSIALLLC